MGYRKNDSRMGDEIFSTGAKIAPFVIILIKKVMSKISKQKEIDPTLPEEERVELTKINLNNKLNFWKWVAILFAGFELFAFLMGKAVLGDITWFILVGACYYHNKKKLERL